MNQPNTLYKYVRPGSLKLILENQSLRFPTPKEFNDPFDCNFPSYLGSINMEKIFIKSFPRSMGEDKKKLLAHIKRENVFSGFHEMILSNIEDVRKSWDEYIENYRVLCLAKEKDNILMWSHYAVNHSGTVVGFDTSAEKFTSEARPVSYPNKNNTLDEQMKVHLAEVFKYIINHKDGIDAAFSEGNAFLNHPNKSLLLAKYVINKLSPFFYVKKTIWEYENEFRFIRQKRNPDSEWLKFDISSVSDVTFGIKTSASEKEQVIALLKEYKATPSVYQAVKKNAEMVFAPMRL
ncbi:DUF2971 domain-containing protein [Enterobacter sp. SA187]|uniref:DUF2971 domain-containing protein n=1 Tax=Enterobacter sp. SA187 TaxID=1914861 RepID=UPI0009335A63|nr:DUF2971 domain-containing protein [Enterobacter sp. SA187]